MAFGYVQGTSHQNGAGSSTTVALTLVSAVVSGNAVKVSVGWASTAGDTVTQIVDDKGNTYTLVDLVRDSSHAFSWQSAYRENITNAPKTITATISASRTFSSIVADEYSGEAASAGIDGHAMQSQIAPATTTDAVKSGAITTVGDGDLIYGTTVNVTGNGTTTKGTGLTQRVNAVSVFMTEDEVQATHGTLANGATYTSSTTLDSYITGVMAFKAAAAAGIVGRVLQINQAPVRAAYW